MTSRRHSGRARQFRGLQTAALLCAAFMLGGCGAMSSMVAGARSMAGMAPKPIAPAWKSLILSAANDANGNSAVAIDLVLAKDAAALESLETLPAAKWFAMRTDLQKTFPDTLAVMRFELVPSQTVKLDEKQLDSQRALGAFIFANYASPGEHRARLLMNTEGYVVQLNEQSFKLRELKSGVPQ